MELFESIETRYLDFGGNKDRVRILEYKVEAIKAIGAPTKLGDIHWFVEVVNY